MKKIIYIVLVSLLLVGCSNNTVNLNEYNDFLNDQNREDIIVSYDFDGIFDKQTLSGLIQTQLKNVRLEDFDPNMKLESHTIEEVRDILNEYKQKIYEEFRFVLSYEYENPEELSVDENNIRFILKDKELQMNIYKDGIIKVIKPESREIYVCNDANFNKDIDEIYTLFKELDQFCIDIIFESSKLNNEKND